MRVAEPSAWRRFCALLPGLGPGVPMRCTRIGVLSERTATAGSLGAIGLRLHNRSWTWRDDTDSVESLAHLAKTGGAQVSSEVLRLLSDARAGGDELASLLRSVLEDEGVEGDSDELLSVGLCAASQSREVVEKVGAGLVARVMRTARDAGLGSRGLRTLELLLEGVSKSESLSSELIGRAEEREKEPDGLVALVAIAKRRGLKNWRNLLAIPR